MFKLFTMGSEYCDEWKKNMSKQFSAETFRTVFKGSAKGMV